jgi:hypothetical protein
MGPRKNSGLLALMRMKVRDKSIEKGIQQLPPTEQYR